jgi:agmatinase
VVYDPDEPPPADAGVFGQPTRPDDAALVLVPVPWDATTSYRPGTASGPEAIRVASHQLDLYDPTLGEPWRRGIAMLAIPEDIAAWSRAARADAEQVIAVGGRIASDPALAAALARVNAASATLDHRVYADVTHWLDRGKQVGVVGGDHSVAFGGIRAHVEREPDLGILHIDAHCDLRDAYEGFTRSHASIMFNAMRELPIARLVSVGIRDYSAGEAAIAHDLGKRVVLFSDDALADKLAGGTPWKQLAAGIVAKLPERVYVSFDIDGLDPSLCPHTGTPVPGGLSFHQATLLIRTLRAAGKSVVGFDLVEVAPGPGGDQWDGNVAARILYRLCAAALNTQQP